MRETLEFVDAELDKTVKLVISDTGFSAKEMLASAAEHYAEEIKGNTTLDGPVFTKELSKIVSSTFLSATKTKVITASAVANNPLLASTTASASTQGGSY